MGNLTESASYDTGVYQLETADPVQGGAAGVSNAPLKNLANRTAYLKQHMDAIENGTFIPSAVAPINSPLFTGDPRAPTPALGDSDTSISTTEFVQKTIAGFLNKSVAGGVNVTLSAIEAGNGIWNLTGALTASIQVIVPNTSKKFLVLNRTSGAYSVTVKTAAGSGIVVAQGKQQELACDGTNVFQSTNDLADIILDGTPTLTNTPAQFDNSQKLVNSAFVQRSLGSLAGEVLLTTATTLNASHAGKLCVCNHASTLTHTLPAAGAVAAGTQYHFYNNGAGAASIQRAGSDLLALPPTTSTSLSMFQGERLTLESDGTGTWRVVGGHVKTAPQFENSIRPASTEFVQRALGNMQGTTGFGAAFTVTPDMAGKMINLTSGPYQATLSPATSFPDGAALWFKATGGSFTIACSGADLIAANSAAVASIAINNGEDVLLIRTGAYWFAFGSAVLKFSTGFNSILAPTGYQRLPTGMILQWGSGVSNGSGYTQFNLATTFPNGLLSAALMTSGGSAIGSIYANGNNFLTIATYNSTNGALTANVGFYYVAVGH